MSVSIFQQFSSFYVILLTLNADFELDVIDVLLLRLLEIGLNSSLVLQSLGTERCKGILGNNPRADGRTKVLTVERTQGNVLPSLDVTSTPVVQENVTKDVLASIVDGNRVTHLGRLTDEASKLELVVESLARASGGLLGGSSGVGEDLALGAADGST